MAGLMKRETKICNQSLETISLIPFSRPNSADINSEFDVRKKLAKNISPGKCELVKPADYDSSHAGPGSQINMLFRRGNFPEKVRRQQGEILFQYTQLGEKLEWNLGIGNNGQVTGGPGDAAGQTSSGANAAAQAALEANAAGTQDESLLERLREEVRQLTRQVEILQNRVADLERRLNEENPA